MCASKSFVYNGVNSLQRQTNKIRRTSIYLSTTLLVTKQSSSLILSASASHCVWLDRAFDT